MPNVVILNFVMLSVANKPFLLNVVTLSVANKPFVPNVVMLSAVMLSVVVPLNIREKLI